MNKYILLIFFLISNFQKVFSEKKPNIVIIMLDDMGYGDIESFGAIDYYTPNINNLADNGVYSEGFKIQVQPTANAGITLSVI